MLQRVTSYDLLSIMDGFSGYNQVLVKELEQFKTTFTTPWGMYVYVRVPFGLKNAGATFQREMDVAFKKFINIIMVVYQDDLTCFSKRVDDHCGHLAKVFSRSLEFGVSLNPKKCHFAITKGKLLGHIVSKEGVKIDPERIKSINNVPEPKNVKGISLFWAR